MKRLQHCPICNSESIHHDFHGRCEKFPETQTWELFRCENCNHGFMNPQPDFEELSEYYTEEYGPYDHENEGPIELLIEEAKRTGTHRNVIITPGMEILDIGCGGGNFLRVAQGLGANVQGIDPSEHAYKVCRSFGLPVYHGMLDEYIADENLNKQFDLITSSHVVEHHPDPVTFLNDMSKLLKPGGMIWIAVPNAGCVWSKQLGDRWYAISLPYHLMQFTLQSAEMLASKSQLKMISISTSELATSLAGALRTWLRYKLYIPRKITMLLPFIFNPLSNRLAGYMDKKKQGQAIIVELKLPEK
jgi:2-polyprenyl-3-methyl-5-hydroxy-6-metoxy-1,4-benzoquinol methylase